MTHILLVDDDDVDREMVRRLIVRSGLDARLDELSCARSLLELEDLSHVDCILLDYRLPDADGLTLLRELTEGARGTPPAVIMLTGEGNERVAVETIQGGADDYLTKSGLNEAALIRSIRNALERRRLRSEVVAKNQELQRLSLYDDLSGLPNRNLYLERLQHAVQTAERNGESFALLVMDLVNFKEVNDSLGHPAGDALLHAVGRRLAAACRSSDTVARIGGDEFAAILPTVDGPDTATIAAQKLAAAVARVVLLEGGPVQVGITIGISLYPEHGRDPETLYRNADAAMYEAKRQRRDCVLFQAGACPPAQPSMLLAGRMAEAIEHDQLELHYQPQLDMSSRRLAGAEALVRWHHPDLGLLPPGDFVPRVERTSMIRPLTFAVLDKGVAQASLWCDRGRKIPVAINVSARLLDDDDLPDEIDRCLRRHDLSPDLLTLEITETGVMTNATHAVELLGAIKSRGVRISIDDFGTGYTSLRSLMSLPLSELKVDKIFIDGVSRNTMESAIVSSIIEISRGFDMTVVAEGVEDEATWSHLAQIGCHHGQGFLISKPMAVAAFDDWFALQERPAAAQAS